MISNEKRISRREFFAHGAKATAGVMAASSIGSASVKAAEKDFRIGLISLDSSHAPNFTRIVNKDMNGCGCKVVMF